LVSKPVPVKVTVAPPAYEIVGLLDVGKPAVTINAYFVTSLMIA